MSNASLGTGAPTWVAADLESRLKLARRLVAEVEVPILDAYQKSQFRIEHKADHSLVTELDWQTEEHLQHAIQREFPSDAILGEELGASATTLQSSRFTWIIDPIDGTQAFACGVPLFGTIIGITFEALPVIGVVHMPVLQETVYAMKNSGCWWQRALSRTSIPAHVSQTTTLERALFCTTSLAGFERAGRERLFFDLVDRCEKFRGWGSCYGHLLVATGRADLMVDPHVKIWDCAALLPILEEAGGAIFDLAGAARIDSGSAISVNRVLQKEVNAILSQTLEKKDLEK